MIRFTANGKGREIEDGVSVSRFIETMKLNPGGVIVEYNREFLPREEFAKTVIRDGDRLEIIRALAGGS